MGNALSFVDPQIVVSKSNVGANPVRLNKVYIPKNVYI